MPHKATNKSQKPTLKLSTIKLRLKAFVVDIFMIYVPTIYFFTYIVAGGASEFRQSQVYPFLCFLIFALIQSWMLSTKAQTLGYKYTNLYIIDIKSKSKPSFVLSFIRFMIFCISYALLFGMVFVLFRKDKISLHDLLTNTRILHKQEYQQ